MKKINVHTDGGCRDNPGPGAWGVVIRVDENNPLTFCGFLPLCTNNQAEYRALEAACNIMTRMDGIGNSKVAIHSDSEVIVKQINQKYRVNEALLPFYRDALGAFRRLTALCQVDLSWVPRAKNSEADALCNSVMDRHGIQCSRKGKPRAAVR